VTTQQCHETEQTIRNILGQLEGPASQRLRVVVTDGVAYVDGHVPEYRRKKAVTQLVARVANSSRVVNRTRVLPSEP
jgi:hypothetical protein